MPYFDIALVLIIIGFVLTGYWFGFISTFGSIIGTLLGIQLSLKFYPGLAAWLSHFTGWNGNFSGVVMFIFTFLVINRLVSLVFYWISRLLSDVTDLPLISSVNKIAGAVFGFIEGLIVIVLVQYVIKKFGLSNFLTVEFSRSTVYSIISAIVLSVWPFFAKLIHWIKVNVFQPF